MKKVLFFIFSLTMPLIVFACGCTDAPAANGFVSVAKSTYDSADSDFASVVNSTNEILRDIQNLTTTEGFVLNDSVKSQQVYYDYMNFTLQNRQMINAEIQQGDINLRISK